MMYDDNGPGQNIKFFLITAGLDVDPTAGTIGYDNYEKIKRAISNQAEILLEEGNPRLVTASGINTVLPAYDGDRMTVSQLIFGVAQYSNPWSAESLSNEINLVASFPVKYPKDLNYSINPYEFIDDEFIVYQNKPDYSNTLQWYPVHDFHFTEAVPNFNNGEDGSVRLVLTNGRISAYIKEAFQWVRLDEYCTRKSINYTISSEPPNENAGDFWFKIGTSNFYKFILSNGDWDSPTIVEFSGNTDPIGLSDGDLFLKLVNYDLVLYEMENSIAKEKIISDVIIRKQNLNSSFSNATGMFNYIVEDGPSALSGGELIQSLINEELIDMVQVYQNGNYSGEYLGINFVGTNVTGNPSINLTADVQIPGETKTEILPIESNGQTIFDVPNDFGKFLHMDVNGISDSNFSYNPTTNVIEFDSLNSSFILETSDEITLVYVSLIS